MLKIKHLKPQHLFICIVAAILIFPLAPARAETYAESVTHAQNNIDNNTNFIPNYPTTGNKAIILIQPGSTDYGLTYQNYSGTDYLSSRTFTKSRNFFNSSTQTLTGVGDTTIYGGATTDAAWVTVGNDTTEFLDGQGATAGTVVDTLERGLGMNNDASHNMIVEYAVLPDNDHIMRPTRKPDIASYSTTSSDYAFSDNFDSITAPSGMSAATLANLKAYLKGWQQDALGTLDSSGNPTWHDIRPQTGHENWTRFPWGELGYTYFWNSGGTDLNHIQGMTEFIILGGTAVKIMGIYSPQSYLYTKNKGGVFSSATDAQYGNGFPNFNITGSCDTIWAGNSFQKNVSASSAAGNENTITIGSNGSVSGGQGILVWSVNYKVTNNGVISGATQNKLYYNSSSTGMTGTANVAVLFKGNSDSAGGSNQLINTGTISSPGTAIEADAGDTTITNNGSGVISGTDYAILTAAGADAVTINGGEITGSVDLGTGNDSFTVSSGSNAKLNFYLDRDTETSAQIVNAETVDIANNTTLGVLAASGTKNFRNNEEFLIAEATTLTVTPANLIIKDDTTLPMVTFSASKVSSKLYLTAVRDTAYYQDNSGNSSLGATLDTLAESASSNMSTIIGALDDTGDPANAQKLEPVAAAPVVNTVIQALNNFGNAFSMQMARLGNDDPDSGVYAVKDGKRERLPASAAKNLLAYNSDSILENSFHRPEKWEVFATGFGVMGFQSDHDNNVGYKSRGGGTQFGFYRRLSDDFMLGMLGGYMFNNVRLNEDSGSQDINSVRFGPCGKWLRGNFYAAGAFTYGYHAVQADRKIQFGIIDLQADSDYSMHDVSPFLETGYILRPWKNLEVVPNVSLQYDWMHNQSYDESGAGAADLSVKAFNSNSLISVLGLRFNGRVDMKNITFLPEFNVGWQHEYLGRVGDIEASFASESAGSFITHANVFDRNAVRAGVAANFIYGKKHNSLSLQYNTEIYDSASNHVFSLTCRNYF
ncbi:MAG: autotransporter domain-containing protein [Candidatus Omnitrophica bacterium]|nr:autotransporter domain-containing protein [Candidatus Omnitrophota bacterium]